jgi:hypothetical protein
VVTGEHTEQNAAFLTPLPTVGWKQAWTDCSQPRPFPDWGWLAPNTEPHDLAREWLGDKGLLEG